MTIGDVLAWVGGIGAICGSAWALYMAVALLFANRANQAADAISTGAFKHGVLGFVFVLFLGPVGVVTIQNPIPVVRLFGLVTLLSLLAFAAIGGAGIALIAAKRIRVLDPGVSPYGALSRGAALIVFPCLVPLLGWFLLGPALFLVGLGAGIRTLKAPEVVPQGFIG